MHAIICFLNNELLVIPGGSGMHVQSKFFKYRILVISTACLSVLGVDAGYYHLHLHIVMIVINLCEV